MEKTIEDLLKKARATMHLVNEHAYDGYFTPEVAASCADLVNECTAFSQRAYYLAQFAGDGPGDETDDEYLARISNEFAAYYILHGRIPEFDVKDRTIWNLMNWLAGVLANEVPVIRPTMVKGGNHGQ